MKKISLTYKLFALLLLQGVLASCGEDDLFSNELYVFTRNWGNDILQPYLTFDSEGNQIVAGTNETSFPLYLSREASVDVKANVGIDESSIESYNEANHTSLEMLPDDAFEFTPSVLIPAGNLTSKDSVKINLNLLNVKPGSYLLPFLVENVESADKGICPSHNSSSKIFRIDLSAQYVDKDNKEVVEGTSVDKTDWVITCTDSNSSHPVTNLIDNDETTTYRASSNSKAPISVDMGEVHNLKGLSFCFRDSYYYGPETMDVYISDDGESWLKIGSAGKYSYKSYTTLKYGINFYAPVSCRHFRLVVTSKKWWGWYGIRLKEIYAIE